MLDAFCYKKIKPHRYLLYLGQVRGGCREGGRGQGSWYFIHFIWIHVQVRLSLLLRNSIERDREKLKTKILNTNINDNRCISEPSGLNQHFLPIYL